MNEVAKIQQMPITEIMTMGKAFVESGMFPDVKSAAMAVVKIQAGQEIGIAPFAAMTGIHIIQGRPTVGAGLIASKVKSSGKYDYKVVEMSDKKCSLDFYQGKEMIGNSTFTIEDARKAQTKNIDKFPKNMLFARAVSNGVKWFTPDVFNSPVYTPEEMDDQPKTEDISAVITTPKVDSVVSNPSDIDNDFIGKWEAEVKACKNETELMHLYESHKETIDADPRIKELFPKKEPIPGHWYAKLEKCLSPEDVDNLVTSHKETVNANPELRKLFVQRKHELKQAKTNALPF